MDYYRILGISETATDAEIKKAYYTLALRCHPDKSTDPESTRQFQEISRAYQVLSDRSLRDRYDRTGTVPEEASANFKSFLNEIMTRWKVDDELAGLVKETISGIKPGDGFTEVIGQLDKNRLFKSGLGIAQRFLAAKKADIQTQLRRERIDRLPIKSFIYTIDLDNIGDVINVDIDIAQIIVYSHIELVFTKTGEMDKRLIQFIDFNTELNIRIWERDLTINFELAEMDSLAPIRGTDLLLRERVNPCQLNQPFNWCWEYGPIVTEETLCLSESLIVRIPGQGLVNWLEGGRGDLWVCFTVDIMAPVRAVMDRIDDDTAAIRDMTFRNILEQQ